MYLDCLSQSSGAAVRDEPHAFRLGPVEWTRHHCDLAVGRDLEQFLCHRSRDRSGLVISVLRTASGGFTSGRARRATPPFIRSGRYCRYLYADE